MDLAERGEPEIASRAIGELATICLSRKLAWPEGYGRLVSLFIHCARFSPHNEVRCAAIDALSLAGEKKMIRFLSFELGSEKTREYKRKMLNR